MLTSGCTHHSIYYWFRKICHVARLYRCMFVFVRRCACKYARIMCVTFVRDRVTGQLQFCLYSNFHIRMENVRIFSHSVFFFTFKVKLFSFYRFRKFPYIYNPTTTLIQTSQPVARLPLSPPQPYFSILLSIFDCFCSLWYRMLPESYMSEKSRQYRFNYS